MTKVPNRRREAVKKRLLALLATAMMLSATVAAPASALPPGNNGYHNGEYSHANNGEQIGAGVGMGKYDNQGLYRRGLR
jgi:hypothetical protein